MVAKPGSLSRRTVTGESLDEAGFSFSVPVVTGDRLDEAAFSPSFPVPSSSTDCCLDDFVPLMPKSCTRTNCEFGASMEDGGCNGRSKTTLGIKFLKKKQHEDDIGALSLFAHLKRPTVTCVIEYLQPRMRMSRRHTGTSDAHGAIVESHTKGIDGNTSIAGDSVADSTVVCVSC